MNTVRRSVVRFFPLLLCVGTVRQSCSAEQPKSSPQPSLGSQTLSSDLCARGYVEVPLLPDTSKVCVQVSVNGKRLLFLIDTGAAVSTIDTREAQELKLELSPFQAKELPFVRSSTYSTTRVQEFKLGSVTLSPRLLNVTKLSEIRTLGLRFQGLLGQDILTEYSAVIDFPARRLFLLSPERERRTFAGAWESVSCESVGNAKSVEACQDQAINFTSSIVEYTDRHHTQKFKFEIHGDKFPRAIDFIPVPNTQKQVPIRAIYRMTGDQLLLCWNWPLDRASVRPKEFKATSAGDRIVIFRRKRGPTAAREGAKNTNQLGQSLSELALESEYRSHDFSIDADGYSKLAVKVNRTSCRALLDSGTSSTSIGSELARKLSLALEDGPDIGSTGGTIQSKKARLTTLQIGAIVSNRPGVTVVDMSRLCRLIVAANGKPIEAIVGLNALSAHRAIVDYYNRKLYLTRIEGHLLARLSGRWKCIIAEVDGKRIPDSQAAKIQVTVAQNCVVFCDGQSTKEYLANAVEGNQFASIDLCREVNKKKNYTKGIFALGNGDTALILVLAGENESERPTALKVAGTTWSEFIFLRDTSNEARDAGKPNK